MRSLNRVLLTGGAGFIGSNLVRHLLARPEVESLIILDALTYAGDKNNLAPYAHDARLEFYHGNILDAPLLQSLFQKYQFTGVLHLAAESHVDRSISSAHDFVQTNVLGTSTLLDVTRAHQVPILLCSTDEVYGPAPFPKKFAENTPLNPSSAYSASKASADLLALAAHTTHGQDIVIARPTNNYGPRQHPEKFIPRIIHHALRDEPLPIYGSGTQIRDWLHVDDCALGLIAAFEKGRPSGVFHLGANDEHTNLGIARAILKVLEKPESLISHVTDRPGHDVRYALDVRLALQRLKWKARIPFREGFKKVVREIASLQSLDLQKNA